MEKIAEILENKEQLNLLLDQVAINILADSIAKRHNVVALRQDGMQVFMIPNK